MKIAVPFEDGQVFQHFGRSAQFKFYEAENGQLLRTEVIPTNGQGHGALAGFLVQHGADVVLCGGIGTGAQVALMQAGIQLFGGLSGAADAAVADYLDACGIANEPCSDILYKQWNKLMVNDGLNQAAAAFDLTYGGLCRSVEAQAKMHEAMQEVIRLANLEGVPLPRDNDEQFLRTAMPTFNPDGMPSMRQDVLAKRPTEVEEFAGVVRARAKKYGMPPPANDFFYARIQEIEAGYCK